MIIWRAHGESSLCASVVGVSPAATGPAVGTIVAPGPAVPTTVAPSPYNSSYPPTAGGVVQGHATQPPPYAAAPTGAVVQGYATPPPQAAQAVGTVVPASPAVAPPPYDAPQAVAEVVAVSPMDRNRDSLRK